MISVQSKQIEQRLFLAAGFLAAGIFVLVSMAANFRFGLTFGTTDLDRLVYGGLSLGADLFKVALPVVVMILWHIRYRLLSATAAVLWLLLVCFSIAAAIGFAAETRGMKVSANQSTIDSREAWKARIEHVEQQLGQLGIPRAAAVIQTDVNALLRMRGMDGCKVINGPVTKEHCPKVDALRKELAVSRRVAELEAELAAARKKLQSAPVAALMADPQSAALSRIIPLSEAEIRDMIAFLIAALVETGSALGFTFMALASRSAPVPNASPSTTHAAVEPQPAQKPARPKRPAPIKLPKIATDIVTRWTLARLDILSKGRTQAIAAYDDFKSWCEAEGVDVCTPQMFGRRFTAVIEGMGGRKVKINGRAYYEGVALQGHDVRKVVEKRLAV